MTPTPRKSGIRLPWSHDDDSDATTAAESGAEASEPTATSDTTPMEAGAQAEAAPFPTPSMAQTGAAAEPSHDPESPEEAIGDVADNALLVSLINAMREVAERERESSVSTLRLSVDETVETLRTRAAEQAEQLRERSEGDISAIGDWVNAETERIATEGERRRETRRQLLTQQLSDHEQRSGTEIESLYARIQEYERQLTTFFAQLHDINDPAAFGTAAKRMPRPPSIVSAAPAAVPPQQADAAAAAAGEAPDDGTPTAATTPGESPEEQSAEPMATETSAEGTQSTESTGEATNPETADTGAEQSSEAAPTNDEAATEEAAAKEPVAEGSSTIVPDTHDARLSALGIDRNGSEAQESVDESAAPSAEAGTSDQALVSEGEAPHDPLRARLAELDAKIGGETSGEAATATVVAPGAGGEVATAIVVHGLGSFGAITSFKQALERVGGVHGISLSLGPTGEFVYRATHDPEFDLVAAIEQIEHGGAQIERQPDGSLRVVVQRGR